MTRLYAWPHQGADAQSPLAEIEVDATGARLLRSRDPRFESAVAELAAAPYLPLTVRRVVDGARHVSCQRLTPRNREYWRAFAEALGRRVSCRVTEADEPSA